MIRRALLLLFLCLVVTPAAHAEESFEFQGRDVVIHLPPNITPGKPLPVVLGLHGGGGNAEDFIDRYGLIDDAARAGMMIVYPEGTGGFADKLRTWNAGVCCGGAKKNNVNDVAYLSALIDELVKNHNADPKHVYATGHSNGAMMSYRLACEIPDKIAAIAPVGAANAYKGICGAQHVPVFHIHGTLDQCARYTGGAECGGCFSKVSKGETVDRGNIWPCDSVPESLAARAKTYGCSGDSETVYENGPVVCRAWKSCPAGSDVTLCDVVGAGHAWPGSAPMGACENRPEGRRCADWTQSVGPLIDIDINGLIFDFFASH